MVQYDMSADLLTAVPYFAGDCSAQHCQQSTPPGCGESIVFDIKTSSQTFLTSNPVTAVVWVFLKPTSSRGAYTLALIAALQHKDSINTLVLFPEEDAPNHLANCSCLF